MRAIHPRPERRGFTRRSDKGFSAKIDHSESDGCIVGHVTGISDVIGFHGESVAELRAAFEESVDDYLLTYQKSGRTPNPF
jgi:predicted HicB family RNase H-like nuclease